MRRTAKPPAAPLTSWRLPATERGGVLPSDGLVPVHGNLRLGAGANELLPTARNYTRRILYAAHSGTPGELLSGGSRLAAWRPHLDNGPERTLEGAPEAQEEDAGMPLRATPEGWFSYDFAVSDADGATVGRADLSGWREGAELGVGGSRYEARHGSWEKESVL